MNLYITDHPGCSSILLPTGPGISFRSTFTKNPNQFQVTEIQKIPVIRMEDIFTKDNPINVLKIDVQGAEFEILEGLGSNRPVLIQCEVSTFEHYQSQRSLLDIMTLLDGLGYFPIVLPAQSGHGDAVFVPNFTRKGIEIFRSNIAIYEIILSIFGLEKYAKWSAEYFEENAHKLRSIN